MCKIKLDITSLELSKLLNISDRTLRSWISEKKKMSYVALLHLVGITGTPLPEKIEILRWSDHAKSAGQRGGATTYAEHGAMGNEANRKAGWIAWWEREGKNKDQKIFQKKSIIIPPKDVLLAEFVGIMVGDGNINAYAICITLDSVADCEYVPYVKDLLKKLFGIEPKLYYHKSDRAVAVVVASKNLVEFCLSIGLKYGNKIKQNLDIPDWIKENSDFGVACVRGLVDTDGCFFNHAYKVNGKTYTYPKIAFTSKSPLLLGSVSRILIKLGFCVRMTKDGNDIRIESQKSVLKYIELIGSSNPKFNNKVNFGDVAERSIVHLC